MFKKITNLIVYLLLIIFISNAYATSSYTARELKNECNSSLSSSDRSYCLGYLWGILQGMDIGEYFTATNRNISVGTLRDMLVHEMEQHPENGDESALILVTELLIKNKNIKLKKSTEHKSEDTIKTN